MGQRQPAASRSPTTSRQASTSPRPHPPGEAAARPVGGLHARLAPSEEVKPPPSDLVAVGRSSLSFTRMRVLGQGECAPNPPTACYPDVVLFVSATDVRAGSPTGPDYETSNPSGWDLTATATLPDAGQGNGI